ncbi:hypothetical protein HID58_012111 [Brassica napus]|uniref:Uncharacterized protein n=3 Tax=Brassica TaxID=3705 RepID=A0ABQ8E058_BRANA|nr:hypothetical protein HID58_012111 [Brassica napus]
MKCGLVQHTPVYKNTTLTSEPQKSITVAVYDPCSEYYLLAYLNSETVQKAIHVKPTNLPYVWHPCNHTITNSWSQDDIDLILWRLGLGGPGDGDMIKNMNLTVEKSWRQWFSGGEVGGFIEEYKGNFTFATVRAACHSVAIDQPVRAFTIFTSFIRNTPLPSTL